jgi:hypothetical protein
VSEVEAAVTAHAQRILARDPAARGDLDSAAEVEPADLFDRLLAGEFRRFELVAHARIGAHHVIKTKYVGPTTMVVQARWVQLPEGRWRIHEAELARVAAGEKS